jgi:hypothetical protein
MRIPPIFRVSSYCICRWIARLILPDYAAKQNGDAHLQLVTHSSALYNKNGDARLHRRFAV